MCFSSTASFTAAAGLSVMGLLSIHAAKKNRSMMPLAASPLFFAAQQACEGIVWVTMNTGDSTSLLHSIGMYSFLFFAAFWWPFWIPFTLYISEKKYLRKKLLSVIATIGTLTGIIMFAGWVFYTTGAKVINHHIDYPVSGYPFNILNQCVAQLLSWLLSIGYCIATITPFFISSIKYMWVMGIAVGTGLVIAAIFYYMAFPSVWCFFAAISSALLYVIVKKHNE